MEYKVVCLEWLAIHKGEVLDTEEVIEKFNHNVNNYISKGWKPIGGITVNQASQNKKLSCYQAMIKE
jgi:hypothetical protein